MKGKFGVRGSDSHVVPASLDLTNASAVTKCCHIGPLVVRPTPNPLFVNIDARIADEAGTPILNLTTVQRK